MEGLGHQLHELGQVRFERDRMYGWPPPWAKFARRRSPRRRRYAGRGGVPGGAARECLDQRGVREILTARTQLRTLTSRCRFRSRPRRMSSSRCSRIGGTRFSRRTGSVNFRAAWCGCGDKVGHETRDPAKYTRHEQPAVLCRLSLLTRCDQLWGVVLLPLSAQPAHGRGTAGRTRH